MFTFELVHIPTDHHKGPDALFQRRLGGGETNDDNDDDSWLNDIALITFIPY